MLTEKDYCDKDLSATLIEIGFRGFGHFYYAKDSSKLKATHQFLTIRTAKALNLTLAVSLYEAQKWLREVKKLHITIYSQSQESWQYRITKPHQNLEDGLYGEDFSSFEEALSEGIKEVIELLKKEK